MPAVPDRWQADYFLGPLYKSSQSRPNCNDWIEKNKEEGKTYWLTLGLAAKACNRLSSISEKLPSFFIPFTVMQHDQDYKHLTTPGTTEIVGGGGTWGRRLRRWCQPQFTALKSERRKPSAGSAPVIVPRQAMWMSDLTLLPVVETWDRKGEGKLGGGQPSHSIPQFRKGDGTSDYGSADSGWFRISACVSMEFSVLLWCPLFFLGLHSPFHSAKANQHHSQGMTTPHPTQLFAVEFEVVEKFKGPPQSVSFPEAGLDSFLLNLMCAIAADILPITKFNVQGSRKASTGKSLSVKWGGNWLYPSHFLGRHCQERRKRAL